MRCSAAWLLAKPPRCLPQLACCAVLRMGPFISWRCDVLTAVPLCRCAALLPPAQSLDRFHTLKREATMRHLAARPEELAAALQKIERNMEKIKCSMEKTKILKVQRCGRG